MAVTVPPRRLDRAPTRDGAVAAGRQDPRQQAFALLRIGFCVALIAFGALTLARLAAAYDAPGRRS